MKRSEINQLIRQASSCFKSNGWHLPPEPKWDVTDFGLGNVNQFGLVLINLAEEKEYCEKLMYARKGMVTPAHKHAKKKEDIICRSGELVIQFWATEDLADTKGDCHVKINGVAKVIKSGTVIKLASGERVTISPPVYHQFESGTDECIIGEVSTANDDLNDNFFVNPDIGRFPEVIENEAPLVKLVSGK